MGLIAACKLFAAALGGREFIAADEAARQSAAASATAAARAAEEAIRKLPKPEAQPDRFNEGAVYTLLLLQREGRLVDFLQEGIDSYPDADIGRAVRQIHSGCRKVLADSFAVKSVHEQAEGDSVTVPAGFDPRRIRLTGVVPDAGPYRGRLAHRGWRATACRFAERSGKPDVELIQAAEIEIG